MDSISISLLSVSSVENGFLEMPGLSPEQMSETYNELSSAIMDCLIPHYRVIGVKVSGDCGQVENVTTKIHHVGKSYTEIFKATENLIFAEGGGTRQLTGVLPGYMLENKGFLLATDKVTSSNGSLQYAGAAGTRVETLVDNEEIAVFSKGAILQLITQKGIGASDFDESGKALSSLEHYKYDKDKNVSSSIESLFFGYMPLRAVYDLNNVILLKPYSVRDGSRLHFLYKRKVNERVLSKLINEYAKTL